MRCALCRLAHLRLSLSPCMHAFLKAGANRFAAVAWAAGGSLCAAARFGRLPCAWCTLQAPPRCLLSQAVFACVAATALSFVVLSPRPKTNLRHALPSRPASRIRGCAPQTAERFATSHACSARAASSLPDRSLEQFARRGTAGSRAGELVRGPAPVGSSPPPSLRAAAALSDAPAPSRPASPQSRQSSPEPTRGRGSWPRP